MSEKIRLSNIELLRFIAMFLVLVVHANFNAIEAPSYLDTVENPLNASIRYFFGSMAIVCVNIFVLISGWFGIRPSKKGFCNLVFQCLFFLVGIYAVMLCLGLTTLSLKGIAYIGLFTNKMWFVKSYILLYILAPALNIFVEKADKQTFKRLLIGFFCFQTVYGFFTLGASFIQGGYSTISFIGLYLLARYVKVYPPKWASYPPHLHLLTYSGSTLVITLICLVVSYFGAGGLVAKLSLYTNPLVIIGALSLLLCFNGLRFQSRMVNWLAASSFAIYLFHCNPNLMDSYFKVYVKQIYAAHSGLECLACLFAFLVIVAAMAILIDQVRIFVWKKWVLPLVVKGEKTEKLQ